VLPGDAWVGEKLILDNLSSLEVASHLGLMGLIDNDTQFKVPVSLGALGSTVSLEQLGKELPVGPIVEVGV
jgi:hypothetical protein